MRNCILSENKLQYDSERSYVVYSIQKIKDASRFLVLQYADQAEEKFLLIDLQLSIGPGLFDELNKAQVSDNKSPNSEEKAQVSSSKSSNSEEKELLFKVNKRIINRNDLIILLGKEANRYNMTIVDKKFLGPSLTMFDISSLIRGYGFMSTFNSLVKPLSERIGVDINPVELLLDLSDRIAEKKIEGRCCIL